jgi:drug/metabolite transporter (DMT)-like permease
VSNGNNKNLFAIFGLLFGACFWGVVWYPYRLLQEAGMSGSLSSFLSYAFALILAGAVFFKSWQGLRAHAKTILLLGLAAGWTNLGYVLAVIDGQVMRVLLLFYLSPLWTLILARFWLKEQVGVKKVVAVAIALVGAMVMLYHPGTDASFLSSRSDWLALSAGIGFAFANAVTKRSEKLSVVEKSFAVWLGVVIVALISMPVFGGSLRVPAISLLSWLSLGLVSVFLLIGTVLVQYGITRMSVTSASVIFLFELVVAAFSSYYLANEVMTMQEVIGGVMITGAALYSAVHQ